MIVRRRIELICKWSALFWLVGSGGGGLRLTLQVVEEAVEGFLVGVVALPIAEIGDEIFADLAGGMPASSQPAGTFFYIFLAEITHHNLRNICGE